MVFGGIVAVADANGLSVDSFEYVEVVPVVLDFVAGDVAAVSAGFGPVGSGDDAEFGFGLGLCVHCFGYDSRIIILAQWRLFVWVGGVEVAGGGFLGFV